MNDEVVVYPSLYQRLIESRINRSVTKWFKKVMTFFFGSSSPACKLAPVDLIKSVVIYLVSSGLLYSLIEAYTTSRFNRHTTVREALSASLIVLFTDISHRYAGHVKPVETANGNGSCYPGIPGGA